MEQHTHSPVSVLMSAIGGYGFHYLNTFLETYTPDKARLAGVVDPFPEKSALFRTVREMKVPIFPTMELFFGSEPPPDLAVISSPIHFHASQAVASLEHGCRVLLDKPLAVTVQDADRIIRAKNESGRWLMVGYQWCYSRAIQALKKDIRSGLLGAPLRFRCLCLWPRPPAYYARNDWVGKKKGDGAWILDSPVANAMAHFLHVMLTLLDATPNGSAPEAVTAELYRAYAIENYDTAACRIETGGGTEILFYVSHAVPDSAGPVFSLECEEATVVFTGDSGGFVARGRRGNEKRYGSPDDDPQFQKLFDAVDSVHEEKPVVCGPEDCRPHTLCMNGIQESCPDIRPFPEAMIQSESASGQLWVKGLPELFRRCYREGRLPGEDGAGWTAPGARISLRDYLYFPGGRFPHAKEEP